VEQLAGVFEAAREAMDEHAKGRGEVTYKNQELTLFFREMTTGGTDGTAALNKYLERRGWSSGFGCRRGNEKGAGDARVKRGEFCPMRFGEFEQVGIGGPR